MNQNVAIAADIGLSAKLLPVIGPYGAHARTYFKAGERVGLEAEFRPISQWGIPSDRNINFKYTLTLEKHTICNFEYNFNWAPPVDFIGLSAGPCNIPVDAKGQGVLTVSVSAKGINQKASTTMYIIEEDYTDLPIPEMYDFRQGSWQWKDIPLGDCKDNTTIGKYGCATTSKAFMFNYFAAGNWYRPDSLNYCLLTNSGYDYYKGCYDGIPHDSANLICAPPDVLWEGFVTGFNLSTIHNYLDSGFPVLLKTKVSAVHGGTTEHYVVAVGKRESGKLDIYDPWDGQIHLYEHSATNILSITAMYLFSQW